MFYSKVDATGHFAIPKVRPGTYTLHAIADGVLGEAIETLTECLVVDFPPHVEEPPRRFRLGKSGLHFSLLSFV